jgi:hypothetical protein
MVAPPLLDTPDLVGPAEGVTVAVFAQPPPLTGSLAGVPTIGVGTVLLAIDGSRIGNEEFIAATALASARRMAHRERDAGSQTAARKPKKMRIEEDEPGRRKKGFRLKSSKETPRKKTDFQTGAEFWGKSGWTVRGWPGVTAKLRLLGVAVADLPVDPSRPQ